MEVGENILKTEYFSNFHYISKDKIMFSGFTPIAKYEKLGHIKPTMTNSVNTIQVFQKSLWCILKHK